MKPDALSQSSDAPVVDLSGDAPVHAHVYGRRAAKLARLATLGLPVPDSVALSFDCVRSLGQGGVPPAFPAGFALDGLFVVRSSPEERAWGGARAITHVGLAPQKARAHSGSDSSASRHKFFARHIAAYVHMVHDIDPLALSNEADRLGSRDDPETLLSAYAHLTGQDFPQNAAGQVAEVTAALARLWQRSSAKLLRQAKGAPEDAGLGLILQRQVPTDASHRGGAGRISIVDARTGARRVSGAYLPADAVKGAGPPSNAALEQIGPEALSALQNAATLVSDALGDAYDLEFVLSDGDLFILDAFPAERSARAAVRIAVGLASRGVITKERALLRVEPKSLVEHLHPQIDRDALRDVFATGLPASPGAATGRVVFTAQAAHAAGAASKDVILVRSETSPEDVRGMQAARGVLTLHGGMSSHAAVIARGVGLPCVVGASDLRLDQEAGVLLTPDGRKLTEGALITIDGASGEAMVGAPRTEPPEIGGALSELLSWADATRTLGVRANADTPEEARMAREFGVDGLGLCRTEHMFFDEERLTAMHELIMADETEPRRAALHRLLPMQRNDFATLFEIMRGQPVTIRLLDPPLHEFLPTSQEGLARLAEALGVDISAVRARAAEMVEVNPMLGTRGVRLGVTMPEIYEMQARAIFEATLMTTDDDDLIPPEIMIPLVSANREVELIAGRIEAVAQDVEQENPGRRVEYQLGVMVETPRAALRSGDLASSCAFLSFGTNDLTQMTYGLSRDDSGRFMREYVGRGVYPEDPFHSLDVEGVGELLLIAANRGRAANAKLVLGLCGEHGGDPASIRFCKIAGFDYVSCSPFRVPIARLAAAQASILTNEERGASA